MEALKHQTLNWGLLSKYRSKLMGISIIWIMLYHGNEIGMLFPKPFELINFVLEKGRGGVDLFLFLSGLGLYYSYSKNPDTKSFYRRRVMRVVIPYLLIAAPFWIVQDLIRYHDISAFLKNVTLYSFWTEGNTRLWYFALLIPLYLLFPFLYGWIYKKEHDKRSNIYRAWVLIALVVLCTYLIRRYFSGYYGKVEIALTRIPVFLLGILCGSFAKKEKQVTFGELSFLFAAYSYRMYTYEYKIKGMAVRYWYASLILVVCFVCVYFFESAGKNRKKAPSKYHLLDVAGKYSLELYIVHIWIRRWIDKLDLNYTFAGVNWNPYGILNYLLILVLSCVIAFIFVKIEDFVFRKT